jgi:hypothetical protein
MKRKRELLTTEDWDKAIETLIEAFDLGELPVFLRRASDDQLKNCEALVEEECQRLRPLTAKHPDLSRMDELDARRMEAWIVLQHELGKASPDSNRLDEFEKEHQRVLEECLNLQSLINQHPDHIRLTYVEALQEYLWREQDRRAGVDDDEEE